MNDSFTRFLEMAREAHYLCTYCLHDLHDECKAHCKQDTSELCRCMVAGHPDVGVTA